MSNREKGSTIDLDFEKGDGLVTAVVQDFYTREILMCAFVNREAFEATRATGLAHYYSRSQGKLWKKGETSGHLQHIQEIRVDCDQDCLLYIVEQTGAACHTGAASCFYRKVEGEKLEQVEE